MLMKFIKLQSLLLMILTCVAGLLMTTLIFTQVIGRYVFSVGFAWTEELARIAMIWTVFLAMPLGFDINAHVGFESFRNKFSPRIRHMLIIASVFASIIVLGIISWGAVIFMLRVQQRTPALGLPFQWIYFVIPFGSINAIFRLIISINKFRLFNNDGEGKI